MLHLFTFCFLWDFSLLYRFTVNLVKSMNVSSEIKFSNCSESLQLTIAREWKINVSLVIPNWQIGVKQSGWKVNYLKWGNWTQVEAIFHVVLYHSFHKSTLSSTPSGGLINTSRCEECVDRESCEAVHQSLTGSRLKGLWCYNSLSFNLIFYVFFSSSFVCLFPWFWLLSFLRRYVHLLFPNASPSFSSQVLLVVCHAFVLFLIFFYYIHTGVFLSVDFFLSLHWLIWTSDVCLSVQSLSELAVCPCSFIFVGRLLGAFATPWARLGELTLCDRSAQQFDPFFLCMLCWSLSLISVILEAALYPFPYSEHNKRLVLVFWNQSRAILPNGKLLFALWFHGKGILHLFISVALLSLSHATNGSQE